MASVVESSPSSDFVLRPHHIATCALFVLAYRDHDLKQFSPAFQLFLHRLLLDEVSEMAKPRTARSLQDQLLSAPENTGMQEQKFIVAFSNFKLETTDQMVNFFAGVPPLFIEKSEEDEPAVFVNASLFPVNINYSTIQTPRSIFGYFCRRCFVGFLKLSVTGVIKLHEDFHLWWNNKPNTGYDPVIKDRLNHMDRQIFKTHNDSDYGALPDSYEEWLRGIATGDESLSVDSIRRFFEQRFHEGNESGLRQHGLLNLVRMHYLRNEWSAARKLLLEAINTTRTNGDRLTLQQCVSLLHRFPPEEEGQKPPLNEIQPQLHPLEILYDVKKLLEEKHEQPLSASFSKIVQSISVFNYWAENKFVTIRDVDQWAQHAVQSVVWNAAGCDDLAAIEADTVIAFTESGGDDNNRLTVILNKAYKRARQGKYESALAMLLEPAVWRGLPIHDYGLWAQEVWHVLALRASRRCQHRLLREYILPRRPPGEFNPRHYLYKIPSRTNNKVSDPLYEVIQMKERDHATIAIEPLLIALWHSEFLFRLNYYRTGVLLLADVLLEFGLTKRCKQMVEDIMPQVITGNDIEQRALAAFTLARCTVACRDSLPSALHDAVQWLLMAEKDFLSLEMYRPATDVQYLLSVVYHNLGKEAERNDSAQRHAETEKESKLLEEVATDDMVASVLDIVSRVGAALSLSR
uniref:Anaphase-promoting complex subunit 5 n=1 Tax=Moniliophthora roreri TaxID=221103 RepID=A0A0W0FGE9_MONRR